mmetsp:Transcript_1688/g.5105  ORF Transcript_1688/g.5105 Transcript_1688/m.5105 type:complete len:232 (-) Transcript_1688:175-870(-)
MTVLLIMLPMSMLHVLRVAKAASTTLITMVKNGHNCTNTTTLHWHDMTPNQLGKKGLRPHSVVVLREPCERFISAHAFIRQPCSHYRPCGPVPELANLDALGWARLLLQNKSLRDAFTVGRGVRITHANSRPFHRVHWEQSAYVDSDTTSTICIDKLQSDLQPILDQWAPGCTAEQARHLNMQAHVHSSSGKILLDTDNSISSKPNELCSAVAQLYPDDVALWRHHCRPTL